MNITSDAAVAASLSCLIGFLSCLIGLNFFSEQMSSSLSTGGCAVHNQPKYRPSKGPALFEGPRFIWHQLKVVHIPNTNTNTNTICIIQIQILAVLGSRFIWRPRVYLTPAEGRAHPTQQGSSPQWSFQTTEPTSPQSVQTLFLLISVIFSIISFCSMAAVEKFWHMLMYYLLHPIARGTGM